MPDPAKETPAEVLSSGSILPTGGNWTGQDLPAPVIGTAGRFRLLGEIARGGMGIVYSALDPQFGREIAVKTLHERLSGRPDIIHRFDEESRITGQLQHPGIPAVFETGRLDDGRPFLAMKLVKGRTLAELLDGSGPNRTDLIPAFEKICQAIAYAHSRHVIHRDLKPANVMVGSFGEVQVMDWGLAKVVGERRESGRTDPETTAAGGTQIHDPRSDSGGSETQAGSMLGTPAYMPPEQAAGAIDLIDERADVFGLGAILCVILTGKPPYTGRDVEDVCFYAVRARLEGCHARLAASGAAPEWVTLTRRCLAPEVADRPRNAGEVAAAVAELRRQADERARQAELDRARTELRIAEEGKRRRVQLALVASVIGFVLLAGGGAWWARQQATERHLMEQVREEREGRVREGVEQVFARLPELYERALWTQAEASLDQATHILGEDGDAESRARVEAARGDTAFLKRLDEIRLGKIAVLGEGYLDYRGASPKYAAAFWDNGFDFDTLSTDELVRLLNASPVRPYLLAALDDWAFTGSADVKQLAAVTTEATGQRWRTRLPEVWNDGARLAKVYDAIPKGERSPGLIAGVGERLERLHQDGVRQVEDGLRQYPGDFWLHVLMGNLGDRSHAERKIGAYRAALALRPGAAAVHFSLGRAMHGRRDLDGAIAYYKEAIRLDPKYAHAHAILGNALGAKGDLDGAIACCREAIRLDPKFSFAHYNLGLALVQKKDLDGAIAAYRVAIGLDPKYVEAHYSLGNASRAKGDLESAIASYREAIRLDPEDGLAYGGLGSTAMHLGRMRDAVDALDKAHSLLPDNKAIHANRTKARRLLVLDQRLSAIKQGTDKPKSASEAVAVAELAGQPRQKEYARSYRLFLFAFADDAKLEAENRYNAACAAVLFAAGEDPKEKPPGKHRTSLLKQAGEWLAADLSPLRELAASEKAADRQRAATTLGHWLWDADLSSVRDPKRLEALPPEERQRWEAFWADVRATLAKAAAGVRKR